MTRRLFLAGSALATTVARARGGFSFFRGDVPAGRFDPYWESLKAYERAGWLRDAIWDLGPLEPTMRRSAPPDSKMPIWYFRIAKSLQCVLGWASRALTERRFRADQILGHDDNAAK